MKKNRGKTRKRLKVKEMIIDMLNALGRPYLWY
jgi:hypothetical protein